MRNAGLKYGGGILGGIGIMGTIFYLFSYAWMSRSHANVDFDPYVLPLEVCGLMALAGILMYIFIEE